MPSAATQEPIATFDFERLNVYQLALRFLDRIFDLADRLPSRTQSSLGDQLRRAALSISNNIAEGNDKRSKKERCQYFARASDSARECISMFNVLKMRELIEPAEWTELRSMGRQITSMIRGLMDSA